MALQPKISGNHQKKASPNHVFFACVFEWLLEGLGQGFGRFGGKVLDLLGVSWGTFKHLFQRFCGEEDPRDSQEASWIRSGCICRGLEEGLAAFWSGFGRFLGDPNARKFQILVDFLDTFGEYHFW